MAQKCALGSKMGDTLVPNLVTMIILAVILVTIFSDLSLNLVTNAYLETGN